MTLFADESAIVGELRLDRLMLAGSTSFDPSTLSDDYIYSKILSAEKDAARRLRVFLEPTYVFSGPPSDTEIAAVPTTMSWVEEAAYDYEPDMWNISNWGYLVLRNKLVSSIDSVQFIYPLPVAGSFVIPSTWIRLDKKAGHVRFVPTATTLMSGAFGSFLISMMAGGNVVPGMIQVRYTAGMANALGDYPDLINLIKRMAVLSILGDTFVPQTGSISADGLSQSSSLDLDKYNESVDSALNKLRDSIHGPRVMVL